MIVSQCPESSDEVQADHDHVLPAIQNLDPQQIIQELTKKWEQISVMELIVEMPHQKGIPSGSTVMEHSEVLSTAEIVKQASDHSVVSADDVSQKQVSDDKEVSPTVEMVKQASEHSVVSSIDNNQKQVSEHTDVSPTDEMVKQASKHSVVSANDDNQKQVSEHTDVSPTDDMVKLALDHNEASSLGDMAKVASAQNEALSTHIEVVKSDHDMISAKDDMQGRAPDQKDISLTNELVKQESEHSKASQNNEAAKQVSDHDDVSAADETIRQASDRNEATQELEMLKQVFGEDVISNSSMGRIEINSDDAEFAITTELHSSRLGSVHSVSSVKKVNSPYKEVEKVETGQDAAKITRPEELVSDDDPMKSGEKDVNSSRAEIVENAELPLDENKKDGWDTEEGGDKQHSLDDVEKLAVHEEQIPEQDRQQ